MTDQFDIRPLDTDESRHADSQRDWSIDPYFSGPEAGDNPERHRGFSEFDRIKTPAERATMADPLEAETVVPEL